jgi:4-amino-4-deoxy-L-arabinose transferase-like glycosyltransferase
MSNTYAARRPLLFALLILGLAAALRLHDIGTDGFWKNELFSITWIRQPVAWLLDEGMRTETNPPLHYLLLKGWTGVFGTSEAAARMPSALATLAAVGLALRLGRDIEAGPAWLLGGLFLAITPVQIVFSHEARAYALLPLFAALAMLGAYRLLRAARGVGTPPVSAALWFGLGCAGLLHTHATGAFAVAALGLATLIGLAGSPNPGPALRRVVLAGLAAGVAAAPVLLALARQSGSDNIAWMPKFGIDTPILLSRYLLIGPLVRTTYGEAAANAQLLAEMGLAAVTAVSLILLAGRALRDGPARAVLLTFPLLFVLLLAVVSLARPILIPRVGLWLSVPICLCVGRILASDLPRFARVWGGGLFACCLAVGLWNNVIDPARHKPDWRALLAAHPVDTVEGPIMVAGPHAATLGLTLYSATPIRRPLRHWVANPAIPTTLADRLEREISGATTIDTDALAALIAGGRGVVLYLDDDDELLIARYLAPTAWFATARRSQLPGLLVFVW